MKSSEVLFCCFEYLKDNALIKYLVNVDVSMCDLREGNGSPSPLIVVLPIRDAIAGQYVTQERESIEIGISCYASEIFYLVAPGQLDDQVQAAMRNWSEPPANFHLTRRFHARWLKPLSAYQTQQIYTFHFRNYESQLIAVSPVPVTLR